jgi:hypothetical protein
VGTLRSPNIEFYIGDPQTERHFSPAPLLRCGMNIPVIVSASSAYRRTLNAVQSTRLTVLAHLDTGASVTSIDIKLAHHIGLLPIGISRMRTAAGSVCFSAFTIDLQFPNSSLSAYTDLPVSSCDLGFDLSQSWADARNFGILIGRDAMTRWNIVWNGPTSTVIIND